MDSAVELVDIVYRWRKRGPVVLDIPFLSVSAGDKVFVAGASGSGKTTLLNLLGGVAVPEQGRVTVLGEQVSDLPSQRRDRFRADRIGFVFQQFNLVPYLSVIDNVLLPCRFSDGRLARARERGGDARAAARHLLERMGLSVGDLIDRSVTELSVGQQQRVAAARALIGAPDLIIADEPTSALDEDAKRSFLDILFAEIGANGQTLVFVSHDRRLADTFDRKIELSDVNQAALVAS